MKLLSAILVLALALNSQETFAKRLGGGGSFGRQSGNVTQRNAAPASPAAAPSQNTAAQQQAATPRPASAVPAQATKRPWGAMLGGLAAGVGLAWLAHTLGFGEALAQFLTIALLAALALAALGWLLRSRKPAPRTAHESGLAYAAGHGLPRDYSPKNVGNDASARPWERLGDAFEGGSGGAMTGAALAGQQGWGIPAGFDAEGFLSASKTNFIQLQAAWDQADIPALRAMMTDEMIGQVQTQLAERERQAGAPANQTEVVMLDAKLLGIEELPGEYMASVEFSGLVREEPAAGPNPFREVWNITRPKSGPGGWLVAGVQALQ
ncbi:MAG: hypothetical protein RJA36_375 [Pseudomonadota bacterium]|jgi:predicted lipid-binding transport protein (Tim44 family)